MVEINVMNHVSYREHQLWVIDSKYFRMLFLHFLSWFRLEALWQKDRLIWTLLQFLIPPCFNNWGRGTPFVADRSALIFSLGDISSEISWLSSSFFAFLISQRFEFLYGLFGKETFSSKMREILIDFFTIKSLFLSPPSWYFSLTAVCLFWKCLSTLPFWLFANFSPTYQSTQVSLSR